MRKRSIDRILRDAVIADAEAQGRQLFPEFEEIPEASQARFDAALYGRTRTEKETEPSPSPAPQRYSTRPQGRFGCVVNFGIGVATVVAILVAVFTLGIFGGSKKGMEGQPAEEPPIAEATPQPGGAPPEAQPTSEPEMTAEPTGEPEPTNAPEQGEPLPYASATFADESEAVARMKHFYEENRTLLMQVAEDMKAPEHGGIENGVVYSIKENGFADLDHPYASMTDAIRAFLDLPDSGDYILHWNDDASLFSVSLRWTNDEGYYSTQLVFSKDAGFLINHYLYERKGVTLEPVTEDGAWGVYTVCWQKAPYWCDSSYAPEQTVGVWGTDDDLLYLELSDDGTARIADLFGEHDIRAHFAWRYDRDYIRITFSDQTVVKTADLHENNDTLTLSLADGGTAEATRAPDDTIPEQPETWIDNGVDGIGVIRGNSNGNLHNEGHAVCDGNYVYYVDQRNDSVSICQYDLASEEIRVLIDIKDESMPIDIGYLNLIGQDLYFVTGVFYKQTQCIYRISLIDLQPEKVYETKSCLLYFLVAYNRLFVSDPDGTTICDMDGTELKRIDGFIVYGAMDGILYAEDIETEYCVSLDLNGNVVDRYESLLRPNDPIPINGYLVELHNYYDENDRYTNDIIIIRVSDKESTVFEVTQIGCSYYYNVSKDWVYLKDYGLDEMGEIYRIDWDGNGFTKVDDRIYITGFSLWENTLLAELVPCEFLYSEAPDGSLDW